MPSSMFGQLVVAQLVISLALVVVLPGLPVAGLRKTADDYIAERLRSDADRLVLLGPDKAAEGDATRGALGPLYVAPWGSRAYIIQTADRRTVARGGIESAMPPAADTTVIGFHQRGDLDLYTERAGSGGRPVYVTIAQDRKKPEVIVDDVVSHFLRLAVWAIPIVLIASTSAGALVVRRLTGQLRLVSAAADRIAPSALDVRLDPASLPVEARGLALATNAALERVQIGYRRQGEFAASVAHELRTPMALLMLRCDAMQPSAERDLLRTAIDQTSHVVDQLFDLAMLEDRRGPDEQVALEDVALAAVEATAPIVYRSGRSIEVSPGAAAALALGSPKLLTIAVTNLIDNAIRHTPRGTHIVVEVMGSTISVADDGPGMTGTRDGRRFLSIGQDRSDSAGLGLAIVYRIMDALGGEVAVKEGGPGAMIALRLRSPAPGGPE